MPRKKNFEKTRSMMKLIAHLFAEKGYHATSLRDIARHLGMNVASLYYYFKNKEEILFRIMNDAMDDALVGLEKICALDTSPREKLVQVLRFYANYYAGDQHLLALLVNELDALEENYRSILVEKQRQYIELFTSILNELMHQGLMKKIPPVAATFAFFGMVHYTTKWYHPDGPIGINELSDYFLEIFTRGILEA